ncbi:uncharacterized protein LOC142163315 [Nicotiana tabacum]|uniref:Uncharacterized protein LOC142163315 n=1 Tax=Nicotiana tabacum TaxID=4097 RepID=A0AC58RVE3_TOBAC
MVDVWRVNDRLMTIKLAVGGFALNMINAYTPQAGLDEEVKRNFWENLDKKREDHLVTFWSTMAKTQIDYLLCRKYDRGMCTFKVIPSECLSTQHRLFVMDLEIKRKRKKRAAYG